MSLDVLIKEGILLPLVEKSGIQSTFVVCNFQGYSIKSKVFDNDLNPKWNEVRGIKAGLTIASSSVMII